MKLSDNLKSIRKKYNLSQEQLAEKLGVSRQAVSKWESGQSYPEMDKVLLICKLFDYNIDELMNESVKEINERKESKVNINKYVEDFFEFITKTVNMFSVMNLRMKLKCFFEQVMIAIFLLAIFLIIGEIGEKILYGIIGSLPATLYRIIKNLFSSIYIILSLVVGIIVILHIFKVRYLDYYEIVKDEDTLGDTGKDEDNDQDNKKNVVLEKNKTKIIIRDPKHTGSKFLPGIFRVALWCFKFIVAFIALFFVFSFIVLISALLLTFLFVKAGLVFIGAFLGILSALIINFIILKLAYNFLISKNNNKMRLAILLLISFVLAGISIGSILIGITQFNFVEDTNYVEKEFEVKMSENLLIDSYNYEYMETDSENIKIVAHYSKYIDFNLINEENKLTMWFNQSDSKMLELIRDIISDINRKEIKDYYNPKVYLYTSKSNIEKIRENMQMNYQKEREQERIYEENRKLNEEIDNLRIEIDEKDNEIRRKDEDILAINEEINNLRTEIYEKNNEIRELNDQILLINNKN